MWTGDKSRPWAEALASRGERIIAVGSNEECEKLVGPETRVIDLKASSRCPDSSTTTPISSRAAFTCYLSSCATRPQPEEFARRIKEHAAKAPAGRWITGGDWDHELWPGGAAADERVD